MRYYSQTYGELSTKEVADKINSFYKRYAIYGNRIEIVVGTDSQAKREDGISITKIVTVIAVVCQGKGGIFFSHTERHPRIDNLKVKLRKETEQSVLATIELLDNLSEEIINKCPIEVHIDIGNTEKSKTKALVKELTGWIAGCGYTYKIKPESYAASTIADRLSK